MTKKEREAMEDVRSKSVMDKMKKIEKIRELLLQYEGRKRNIDPNNWKHFAYNYARCEEYIEFHNLKRAEIIFDKKCDCLCVKSLKRIWVPGSECCSDAMDDIADGLMPNYYI